MLSDTFFHNYSYEIVGRFDNLYYGGVEMDSTWYAYKEESGEDKYVQVDRGGYVYLVKESTQLQSLIIPIKVNYVISDVVFDIYA